MRNFKIVLEYDGSDFHGWQVQPGLRTVQGELVRAIEEVTGERSAVTGAGRTDAGVHAAAQVASFLSATRLEAAVDRVHSGRRIRPVEFGGIDGTTAIASAVIAALAETEVAA